MEKKLTEQEAEQIQRDRDARQTQIFKEFCQKLADLPADFQLGSQFTEEEAEKYLKPVANDMYQFVRDIGGTIGDVEKIDVAFKGIWGFTMGRALNFTDARMQIMLNGVFGYSDIVREMPIEDIVKRSTEFEAEDGVE